MSFDFKYQCTIVSVVVVASKAIVSQQKGKKTILVLHHFLALTYGRKDIIHVAHMCHSGDVIFFYTTHI